MSSKTGSIESVINGIIGSVEKENREFFESILKTSDIENAIESAKKCDSSDFYIYLMYPFSGFVDCLLSTVTDSDNAKFFLKHGEFVERHFLKFIEKKEGQACCADKSGFIMRSVIKFYMTGKPIDMDYSQEYTYHLPKTVFNTHDKIIEFAASIQKLYYGRYEDYIKQVLKIESVKIEGTAENWENDLLGADPKHQHKSDLNENYTP